MSKIFKKIPIMAIVLAAGVLSVSLTAYAYFSYTVQVKVEKIQTADYAINVTPVQETAVAAMSVEEETSFAFADLGITGSEETEVSFKLVASGTTTAGGYCKITVGDTIYYTNPIAVGQNYVVTIKGNKDTVVNFDACWGSMNMDGEHAQATIIGDYASVETPSATPSASPSVAPSETPSASPSTEPSEAPSEAPSASPSAAPSASPSAEPSAAPSASPSAEPSAASSASPSAEPSTTPSASPSTAPSAEPSTAPSASPSEAPSATPSTAPSEAPSAEPSASPSEAPSTRPSEAPSAKPSVTPSAEPSEKL